jgi:ribonuclease HII
MRHSDIARMSVTELRERFIDRGRPLPSHCEEALRDDGRAGARAVYEAILKRRRDNRAEGQRLRHLLRYEGPLWDAGVTRIAGVDEAGMAPLAGPVVAAAVILPRDFRPRGIDDSKQVDAGERERLCVEIKREALCWAVGVATVDEIDAINIYRAGLLAMRRAVEGLAHRPEHLLIDARRLAEVHVAQTAIIHGDALSLTIAAASIIAKTTRDAMMVEYDAAHPGWGFARHKGYPTAEHFDALERLGVCVLHRRSFAPVRQALGLDPVQGDLFAPPPPEPGAEPCPGGDAPAGGEALVGPLGEWRKIDSSSSRG